MTGDSDASRGPYEEPRVPTALRERVDELFVAYRGYEPATFQESLSAVVDLAGAQLEDGGDSAEVEPASADRSERVGDDEEPTESPASHSREPTPTPGSSEPVRFDEYVGDLEGADGDPSPAVASMLDTEHADGVVRELAAEVLDEMTEDAFEELEHGVDQGVAGVTDGMGATDVEGGTTAPSGSVGDGVPESLTADPESDCVICGLSHPVSVLQTTILDEDGSVALVCPSCSE